MAQEATASTLGIHVKFKIFSYGTHNLVLETPLFCYRKGVLAGVK